VIPTTDFANMTTFSLFFGGLTSATALAYASSGIKIKYIPMEIIRGLPYFEHGYLITSPNLLPLGCEMLLA
jgi:hypothetical protein